MPNPTLEQRAHLRELAGIIEFNLTNGYVDVVAGYAFEVVNLAIPLLDEVERLEKALTDAINVDIDKTRELRKLRDENAALKGGLE